MSSSNPNWIDRIRAVMRPNRFSDRLYNLERKVGELGEQLGRTEGKMSEGLTRAEDRIEPLRDIMRAMRKDMIARDRQP